MMWVGLAKREGGERGSGDGERGGGGQQRERERERGREQWYVLVLPARQGAAVRPIASPSATGSSGACWFSQRGREQWYVLVLPA